MNKRDIINAYCKIRTIDQTIPDDVLDFMKGSAIEKLSEKEQPVEQGSFDVSDIKILHGCMSAVKNSQAGAIYSFTCFPFFPPEKYEAVKKAIQDVLNDKK